MPPAPPAAWPVPVPALPSRPAGREGAFDARDPADGAGRRRRGARGAGSGRSARRGAHEARSGDRGARAGGRARQLDHLQCRQGPAAPRRVPRRHGRLLRGRRRHGRFLAYVRLLAGGDRRGVRDARPPGGPLLRRQGLDPRGGCARAGRGDRPALGRRALRPPPGPQPDRLGAEPRHSGGDEGGRRAPLHRRHHLARPPAWRAGEGHASAPARFRSSSPTISWTGRRSAACCRWRGSAASPSSATGPSGAAGCRTGSPAAPCPAGRPKSGSPPGRNSC